MFSHLELAKELLTLVSNCESRLMELVGKSEASKSAEEHKRFKSALGRVLCELGDSFLFRFTGDTRN